MEFTVVESSTDKELTPAQLAELRTAVTNYLAEQGYTSNRMYYVKVSFPAANPDEKEQWAVVRIGTAPTRTYTVLAAYPGPDDYYPYDYYRYGYNSSYGQFSRFGYYDPFDYNYGSYSGPVHPPRDHGRNHDKPDKSDGKPDRPPIAHTRWNNPPRDNTSPPRTDSPPRWNRDRSDNGGGRSYTPPSAPSYSPPPARSEPAPQVKNDGGRSAALQPNEN